MRATWLAILIAAATVPAAAAESAMQGVIEQVQVEARADKVVVQLTLHNGSAQPVYAPKAVFEDQELFGPAFRITEAASGAEVPYAGPMVKRGPLGKDDFLRVVPGATRSNRIDISNSYAFPPGPRSYQLSYAGSVLADTARIDTPIAIPVAPVTFTR